MQPLVENAVYHGLEPKPGPGSLWIRARMEQEHILLSVQDDGMGMSVADRKTLELALEAAPLSNNTSIGLANVYSRLRLLYGRSAKLRIESHQDEGTLIELQFSADANAV